jgi:hypothetical protein
MKASSHAVKSQLQSEKTEAGILARLIQAREDNLSRDAANYLLSLSFDADDITRMNQAERKGQIRPLTSAETAELDSYIHVSNLLAIMQSKARRALRQSNK